MKGRRAGLSQLVFGCVALLVVAACSNEAPQPNKPTPKPSTARPISLTFGVFGAPEEVLAYSQLADLYALDHDRVEVEVASWEDRDDAARAYRQDAELPDVFMVSRRDLSWFTERDLTQPVDELLDERGVSFGDDYARDALQAFAEDNSLACMPYSISPMVIFYNTDLVDFDKMRKRGLNAPDEELDGWDFEQFTAAAQFATRPGKRTRGVYIEPTLLGLSPFIYAGGGQVFEDEDPPTSLAFSEGDTQSALDTTLTLLRDARFTPTRQQLAQSTPTSLFEEGKVGMIAGFRSLVPELRKTPDLDFDVMPIPSISRSGTVGDVTGLCISNATESAAAAADFLVHVLAEESVAQVAQQGYLVPANVGVATSEAFLQPTSEPLHAGVFNASVRNIVISPLLDDGNDLEDAVGQLLMELVTVPLMNETVLADLTAQIDAASLPVLSPVEPTISPSGSTSSPAG